MEREFVPSANQEDFTRERSARRVFQLLSEGISRLCPGAMIYPTRSARGWELKVLLPEEISFRGEVVKWLVGSGRDKDEAIADAMNKLCEAVRENTGT